MSSKNFFLVSVTLIGLLLLLIPAIVLIVEVAFNHTIQTDLNGMAAYIASVAGLFATAGITKAWSEKYEKRNKHNTIRNGRERKETGEYRGTHTL